MDFHEHVGTEISGLIDSVLDRQLEQSRRDLEGVREVVGLAAQTLDTALSNRQPIEPAEVSDIVARLTAAADERARSAAQRAGDEAEVTLGRLRAHIQALESELQEQKEQAEVARAAHALEIREQVEAARVEAEARTNATLEGKWQQARQLLSATRGELTEISGQLQREATDKATLAAALSEAHQQLQAVETERDELTTQLAERAALIDSLEQRRAENERVRGELKTQLDHAIAAEMILRQQVEDAMRQVSQARAEAESAMRSAADSEMALYDMTASAATRRGHERQARRGCAVRFTSLVVHQLFTNFQRLAKEPTVWSVLTALVAALAREFSRVALFTFKGTRLESVHQVGFDLDIATIALPIGLDRLLAQAATSGRAGLLLSDGDGNDRVFGQTPAFMVALPIVANGRVFGIVYADDVDQKHVDSKNVQLRIACAELLMEYASGVLLRLLIKRSGGAEVPQDQLASTAASGEHVAR